MSSKKWVEDKINNESKVVTEKTIAGIIRPFKVKDMPSGKMITEKYKKGVQKSMVNLNNSTNSPDIPNSADCSNPPGTSSEIIHIDDLIDDLIGLWHDFETRDLHEFLGLSLDEYKIFVAKNKLPKTYDVRKQYLKLMKELYGRDKTIK